MIGNADRAKQGMVLKVFSDLSRLVVRDHSDPAEHPQ